MLDPDLESGRRTLEAAVAYFEADASVYGYVSMLFLSANAVQRGAFDEALSLRRRVLEATEKAHYPVLIAWAHWNLALVLYGTGDVTDATRHNDIALRQMVVDGYQEGIASCGGMRALIEFSAGRRESAVMLMGATAAIISELGVIPWPELTVHLDAVLEKIRAAIGEAQTENLLARGGSLSLDEFIDLALDSSGPGSP